MSSAIVIQVPPKRLRYKVLKSAELDGVVDGDWDLARVPLERTDKHRSIVQRYVDGMRWEDTEIFRNQYKRRFARGEMVRGASTIEELAAQYYSRVDGLFEHLKLNGFVARIDGHEMPIPAAYVDRDGEILLGNNGGHRVAMANVLGLDYVLVRLRARHAKMKNMPDYPLVSVIPPKIPAMTTDEERRCYYRLAYKSAHRGAVIELGAWLGAATAWLATAVRDCGVQRKVQVYDRFVWDETEHERKAPGAIAGSSALAAFRANLGDLIEFVDVHQGDIRQLVWTGEPIALIIFDAPKRVPAISRTLTEFAAAVQPSTLMAWQDFAHFPSYEIVASLSRLEESGNLKFVNAVYPGTTVVVKVRKAWSVGDVSQAALALKQWRSAEIVPVWERWADRLPEPMRATFLCGAATFLCDIGAVDSARDYLRRIAETKKSEIIGKWVDLREHRPDLVQRYQPLFDELFGS